MRSSRRCEVGWRAASGLGVLTKRRTTLKRTDATSPLDSHNTNWPPRDTKRDPQDIATMSDEETETKPFKFVTGKQAPPTSVKPNAC